MERLWAPWRMSYIDGSGGKSARRGPTGCIFCDKPAEDDDAANLIVLRGQTAFVILNAFPYNNGHVMVVPYRHVCRLTELSVEEHTEIMTLSARLTEALDAISHPEGYNIGMNLGAVAGAGIADHLHMHIVPRWGGDTNFMPVVGGVKVMPESLEQVYAKLTGALNDGSDTTP